MMTEITMPKIQAGVKLKAASKAWPETMAPIMPPTLCTATMMLVALPMSRRPNSFVIITEGPTVHTHVPNAKNTAARIGPQSVVLKIMKKLAAKHVNAPMMVEGMRPRRSYIEPSATLQNTTSTNSAESTVEAQAISWPPVTMVSPFMTTEVMFEIVFTTIIALIAPTSMKPNASSQNAALFFITFQPTATVTSGSTCATFFLPLFSIALISSSESSAP